MPGPLGYQGGNFAVPPLEMTLAPLQAFLFPPGDWEVMPGRYTSLEWYDANLGFWRAVAAYGGGPQGFSSDGTNYRLINRTGGPIGAVVTNLGSGYTSAPTVVEATTSGGSKWHAVVGGAINTSVTVTTGGSFNYVPTILFPPAPAGGITPTAIAVISGGTITSVTVTNRGAGLKNAPVGTTNVPAGVSAQQLAGYIANQGNKILVIQDPRDTGTGGAVLTINSTLAGSGVVTAVICDDPGTAPVTSLPTLTFSGGGGSSAAATVVMCWAVTGLSVGGGGGGYGTSQPFAVMGVALHCAATDASGDVNNTHNIELTQPRNFLISGTSTSGGAVTATGAVVEDAGWGIQAIPSSVVIPGNTGTPAIPSAAATVTIAVGGVNDTSFIQQKKL